MALRPLVAGNWKMNGSKKALDEIAAMAEGYDAALRAKVDLMICPPATLLQMAAVNAIGSRIAIGAQDCHTEVSGAFTGDIAPDMLVESGATAVIVGHSERRQYHGEADALVAAKAFAAIRAGLTAIVCVGETRAEREAGKTLTVIGRQVQRSVPEDATPETVVVAYEPVWAIGSGLTPTAADVAEVHALIRKKLVQRHGKQASGIRLLYGGSVKPSNARELMAVANVDGALVGGASLKATDFLGIAAAYR
ncbi:MAG: triose-phosphate isomerase [Phreatobacter sp.]